MKSILKKASNYLPYFIGLFTGLYFVTLKITGIGFTHFAGNLADGRLNLYFLEHAHQFFTGVVDSFWDAPFFYPEKNAIGYSDNLLGSAPIYSFFRLIGLSTLTAYQWWYVSLAVLNFSCAYLFLNNVFKNRYSAVLGAMVFAFSIALFSQLAHAQTFPRFAIPLALLYVFKFDENLDPKHFFLAVLMIVYQIYCGIYLGFMLIIPSAILLLLILIRQFKVHKTLIFSKSWLTKMSVGLIVNVLILLPLMLPYLERSHTASLDHYFKLLPNVPTLTSHFFSFSGTLFWDFLSQIGGDIPHWWNHRIFAGGVATLCFIFFLFKVVKDRIQKKQASNKDKLIFNFSIAAFLTFFIYIRFDELSTYIVVYFLPGFSAIRSLARIINIELIFFAFATSFTFSLISNQLKKYQPIVFVALVGLILIDNATVEGTGSRTEKSEAETRLATLVSIMEKFPVNSVVSYEPIIKTDPVAYYLVDGMLAAQVCNLNAVNGYSAKSPAVYYKYWKHLDRESRNDWFAYKKYKIDTIYAVYGKNNFEVVTQANLNVENPKNKLLRQIEKLKSNPKFFKSIKLKAKKRGIPVDSMLKLDAIWLIERR